jgi:hypothetical protein
MAHRTVNQQDKDKPIPPADGDVEVVNAAGERKPASLPQRVKEKVRDTLSMTDQPPPRPPWLPGELDAEDEQLAAIARRDGSEAKRELAAGDTVTLEEAIAELDQPPSNVLATYRRQHAANTAAAVDEVARKVGQLVGLDRRARHYAYDVQHLIGIHALCAKAIDQLADHDLVSGALIRELVAEVAGWQQDREVGS